MFVLFFLLFLFCVVLFVLIVNFFECLIFICHGQLDFDDRETVFRCPVLLLHGCQPIDLNACFRLNCTGINYVELCQRKQINLLLHPFIFVVFIKAMGSIALSANEAPFFTGWGAIFGTSCSPDALMHFPEILFDPVADNITSLTPHHFSFVVHAKRQCALNMVHKSSVDGEHSLA